MTFDLTQFHQIFFEEVAEHVATMERLLLALDTQQPSSEDLNAIFRAAHSIKGGAATFGFADMADFTHALESLLERVRTGKLAVTPELVDACLASGDVLRDQLAGHQYHAPVDPDQAAQLQVRLLALAEGKAPGHEPEPALETLRTQSRRYVIAIPAGLLEQPSAVAALCEELGRLGSLEVEVDEDGGWRGVLQGDADEREVREVLGWIVDASRVSVQDHGPADGTYGFLQPVVRQADPGYGFFEEPAADEDPGFGFFEPLPVAGPASDPVHGGGDDPGYGFFEPLPTPSGQDVAATAKGEEGQGYGFFEPRPAPAPAPTPVPPRPTPVAEGNSSARRGEGARETTIRVGVDKVDQLINLVGELVITNAMLAQGVRALDPAAYQNLHQCSGLLERNARELQEAVLSIRMLPMSFVFNRFPRVVRDLAGKFGKQVELLTEGEGTELDKGMIERIIDPLTHLLRNSLDHGLEMPDERRAAGKSGVGTVRLSAVHRGGHVVIEVADDGRGLNRERLLAKARERGLSVGENPTDSEVWQLIFHPGFSTAERVTDISGRGVGMDVVKANIESIGGRVALYSKPGEGTRTVITLPLTLAILDGMSVGVGAEVFVIPLTSIIESLQPQPGQVRAVSGRGPVLELRGEFLPVLTLRDIFGLPPAEVGDGADILVVLGAGTGRLALAVDALLGQQQVVIKSLESNYRRVRGIAGATIMGDGKVALILDVSALVNLGQAVT